MGMFLVCLFFGWFGLHKFLEGKKGQGILYLCTIGLCGIGWLADCIVYLVKWINESKTQPNIETTTSIPTPQTSPIAPIYETHKVTGTNHYLDNIKNLATPNSYYDLSKSDMIEYGLDGDRIYQYDYYPKNIELVPEPDNPHDTKAIKVIIDGEHVGYIKQGSCPRIHNLINKNLIEKIDAEIEGGKYKIVLYDEYEDKYSMEKDEKYLSVNLKIFIKKEVEE